MTSHKTATCAAGAIFFGWMMIPQPLLAGITGTLAGAVIDGETGKPLAGANIIIKSTRYGAAADAKGQFLINNLPPGRYTVTAQMLGYANLTKTEVLIHTDVRTNLDFALTPTTLTVDQEIVVTATRELIQMDVTGSQHEVQSEMIKALPVSTPEEVVNLQPGVVEGHIRGGRMTEVLYLVDGIPVQEAISGGRGISVPNVSTQTMTIQTGGFNAEYGNAMSGIVNIITHEGGDKTKYYLEGLTDVAGGISGSWDGTAFNRLRNFEGALSGPIARGLKYYVSAQYQANDTRWRRAFEQSIPGPIEENFHANGKLSLNFNPTQKLVLQGLLSRSDWRAYEHRWVQNLEGLPPRAKDSFRLNATWTHTLSERMFYTAKVSYYNILKSVLGRQQSQYDLNLKFDEQNLFILEGHKAWWQDSQEIISNARLDFVRQINHAHQLKAGFELNYYDLYMNNIEIEPFPPNFHPELPPEYRFNGYNTNYRYFPKMGALYAQDKFDLKRFSMNLGLRFDYLSPAGERPEIEDIFKSNSNEIQIFISKKPVSKKHQLSPRLGVAFPFGKNDKMHLNYGHFFQAPLFEYLYTNLEFDFTAYNPLVGNPDLAPEKTVALEVGYEKALGENFLFSVTAFNKDIKNLIDVQFYPIPLEDTGLQSSGVYTRFVNLAYGTANGLELFVRKQQGKFLRGQISYTLMQAKGSTYAIGDKANILQFGGIVEQSENDLSWDQRHTVIIHLDFFRTEDWDANAVWRINSPKPYTLDEGNNRPAGKLISPNNRRLNWTNYLDLKARKIFYSGWGKWALQLDARNLLDNRNLLWRDQQGRIGGVLDDPTAYGTGRRVSMGLIWSNE